MNVLVIILRNIVPLPPSAPLALLLHLIACGRDSRGLRGKKEGEFQQTSRGICNVTNHGCTRHVSRRSSDR